MYENFNGDFDIRFDNESNIYHICANGVILTDSDHVTHNNDCKGIDAGKLEICEDFLLSEYDEDMDKIKAILLDSAILYAYANSRDKNEPKMCMSCLINMVRL